MAALAALARPVVLSPGEALFNEGDPADAAYVVVAGRVAVSAFASSAGVHALLAVCGRGSCVGESGLVVAGTLRTTRAVALTSAVLLRLSHDSLSAVLARRPRVWRAVRNSVVWRAASQLVRLPLLSFLVGGESESGRLAPLADLFVAVVLTEVRGGWVGQGWL
jgi:CRP-like cAMP-binding protein